MRSSKSRSRSKNNRNRSVGNIINRVFDSSGPEGKVRGTPQQIIDKYSQLTRDSQLGNDRVAAENFQQHAEHYTRILGEGMREMEAKREQQEREQRDRQKVRDEQHQQREEQNSQRREQNQQRSDKPVEIMETAPAGDLANSDQPDVMETAEHADSGLVATPEEKPVKKRAPRRRKPKETSSDVAPADTPEAAAE